MTEDMKNRIVNALERAWNSAGHDCFLDDEGQIDESATLTKEEVVEITLDCLLDAYGGDAEAARELFKLRRSGDAGLKESNILIDQAFPTKFYCM